MRPLRMCRHLSCPCYPLGSVPPRLHHTLLLFDIWPCEGELHASSNHDRDGRAELIRHIASNRGMHLLVTSERRGVAFAPVDVPRAGRGPAALSPVPSRGQLTARLKGP